MNIYYLIFIYGGIKHCTEEMIENNNNSNNNNILLNYFLDLSSDCFNI